MYYGIVKTVNCLLMVNLIMSLFLAKRNYELTEDVFYVSFGRAFNASLFTMLFCLTEGDRVVYILSGVSVRILFVLKSCTESETPPSLRVFS